MAKKKKPDILKCPVSLVAGTGEISNFVLLKDLANIVKFLGDPDKIPS